MSVDPSSLPSHPFSPSFPPRDVSCIILYDVLRPRFIHAADVEALCELVDIVRAEVLEEQLGRRGEAVAGLRPTVQRLLADIQERLIFRAHAFMRDEVRGGYRPYGYSIGGRGREGGTDGQRERGRREGEDWAVRGSNFWGCHSRPLPTCA